MSNAVVAALKDKKKLKGHTNDFFPTNATFHIQVEESGERVEVHLDQLKALFFVKSFEGDPAYVPQTDIERPGMGRKIQVQFKDHEILIGYTSGYHPNRPYFYVFPPDPKNNNDKVFVLTDATAQVTLL